eukprot:TRINITY_DN27414_c0_g1_i1.p1 TRINITY_DN27414_c0_g1~~TRINITY_DN27414_c0_g1_i1.p1  ORF type:complete len:571 (-),score=83.73 TRINITY_DN27414_c0_g1_i1:200-1870(-)
MTSSFQTLFLRVILLSALILVKGKDHAKVKKICPQIKQILKNSDLWNRAKDEHPYEPNEDINKECPEGKYKGEADDKCRDFYRGGVVDAFDDAHTDSAWNAKQLRGLLKNIEKVHTVAGLPRRFAASRLIVTSPAYYFTEALSRNTSCYGKISKMSEEDEKAWPELKATKCKKSGIAVCKCKGVICWPFQRKSDPDSSQSDSCDSLELSIVGIVTGNIRLGNPKGLERLPNLLFLDGRQKFKYSSESFPRLPKVQTLMLSRLEPLKLYRLPENLPEGTRWLTVDLSIPTNPEEFTAICKLKSLQSLRLLNGAKGLPSCFGSLSELLALDLRGGSLGDLEPPAKPLPEELNNLTKMVDFIAFEQGHIEVGNTDSDNNELKCPAPTCEPSYQTVVDYQHEAKYRCKSPGHPKPWSEDLNTLPVFKWNLLEKFWVDANHLWASDGYLRRAAAAWPRMRTIDLYDNKIKLDAAELGAFSNHKLLFQFQLQYNQMYGRLPRSVFNGTSPLATYHMQLNSELEGCFSKKYDKAVGSLYYVGTKIKVGEQCEKEAEREKQVEL